MEQEWKSPFRATLESNHRERRGQGDDDGNTKDTKSAKDHEDGSTDCTDLRRFFTGGRRELPRMHADGRGFYYRKNSVISVVQIRSKWAA